MGIFNGFPPVSDPSWPGKTRKLLEFLDEPRNWKQLKAWSSRGALLRQSLAFLEHNGEAGTFTFDTTLYWVVAGQLELFKDLATETSEEELAAEPADDPVEP